MVSQVRGSSGRVEHELANPTNPIKIVSAWAIFFMAGNFCFKGNIQLTGPIALLLGWSRKLVGKSKWAENEMCGS